MSHLHDLTYLIRKQIKVPVIVLWSHTKHLTGAVSKMTAVTGVCIALCRDLSTRHLDR